MWTEIAVVLLVLVVGLWVRRMLVGNMRDAEKRLAPPSYDPSVGKFTPIGRGYQFTDVPRTPPKARAASATRMPERSSSPLTDPFGHDMPAAAAPMFVETGAAPADTGHAFAGFGGGESGGGGGGASFDSGSSSDGGSSGGDSGGGGDAGGGGSDGGGSW